MPYISVTQYAHLRGCTRQNIIKKIKRKTLKAKKIGNQWVIRVDKLT